MVNHLPAPKKPDPPLKSPPFASCGDIIKDMDDFSRELGAFLRSTLPGDPVPELDDETVAEILYLALEELERVGEGMNQTEKEWADLLAEYGPSASG